MADVFISYRRDDKPRAQSLANALKEEGLDVWWDAGLQAGETFDETIRTHLDAAKAIILCWSPGAVESEWVRGEGMIGRERGVLVPVMLKPTNIPVPFNMIHTADLTDWNGDRSDPAYQGVVARVKELADKRDVKPLKPPPNRALRRLWQTVAVIGVIAIAGASLWVFKPWESAIGEKEVAEKPATGDPAALAAQAKEASDARLAAFGLQPDDFTKIDWKGIAQKRFKPETYPDLVKLADTGDASALALLCAVAYWGGPTIPENNELAWTSCRKSAEAGDPVGQTYYAYILSDREEKEAATEQFEKAAAQKFSWALLSYGYRLEQGQGVPADPPRAEEMYKQVQAQGLPAADYALSDFYRRGMGGDAMYKFANPLLESAADRGYPIAMYELGGLYRRGANGYTQDNIKARAWWEKAAAQTDNAQVADRARGGLNSIDLEEQRAREAAQTPPDGDQKN